jgi:predicted small metal-binding protein
VARRVACECGFAVEGDEAEVVAAALLHAKDVHGMVLTPTLIQAVSQPVGTNDRRNQP